MDHLDLTKMENNEEQDNLFKKINWPNFPGVLISYQFIIPNSFHDSHQNGSLFSLYGWLSAKCLLY